MRQLEPQRGRLSKSAGDAKGYLAHLDMMQRPRDKTSVCEELGLECVVYLALCSDMMSFDSKKEVFGAKCVDWLQMVFKLLVICLHLLLHLHTAAYLT